ncbi:phage tail protein [Chelativorans sp. ZYF759]|uniref:tail protein X n=1 Tax=Chelativorans sp. ZYF759 TaxID=2692213 RepID=UPI00145F0D17|nr:tail protein X [Chelativorans sp. ZYF759]NMG39791.1 phage tail protein [Chelativorans sp. ZYF759]
MERMVVQGEGITLDLILWRLHGVRGRGLVEAALAANAGLADAGAELPIGTVVLLPALPAETAPAPRPVISLFG